MAADDDQVGELQARGRAVGLRPAAPASTISVCRGIVTKPSARLNVVTEPEPLPIGKADRPRSVFTRPTSRYSVRPISEFVFTASVAATVSCEFGGSAAEQPNHRRDEFVKRENRRRRKAGQITTGLPSRDGQAHRLARLERDAVGDDARIGQFGDDAIAEIALAFAGAAGEQHDVGLGERRVQHRPQGVRRRRGRCPSSAARRRVRAPRRPEPASWNRRPAPGRIGSPGAMISLPVEMIATRGRRQTVTAIFADRRQHAGLAAGQHRARSQDRFAAAMSVPAKAIPKPGRHGPADEQLVAARPRRVRPSRPHRRRGAPCRRWRSRWLRPAADSRAGARPASSDFGQQPRRVRGDSSAGAERVGGADGEAVEVRAVERRHIDAARTSSASDAAQAFAQGNLLPAPSGCKCQRGAKPRFGFVAIDDVEKLILIGTSSITSSQERWYEDFDVDTPPADSPSLSAGTIDKTVGPRGGTEDRCAADRQRFDLVAVQSHARVVDAADRRDQLAGQRAHESRDRAIRRSPAQAANRAAGEEIVRAQARDRIAGQQKDQPTSDAPMPVGLLGRIAMPWIASSPCSATSIGAWSSWPTLEPPETRTMSARSSSACADRFAVIGNDAGEDQRRRRRGRPAPRASGRSRRRSGSPREQFPSGAVRCR